MSQFYYRYKSLFAPQTAYSNTVKNIIPVDRFKRQILPKLEVINKSIQKSYTAVKTEPSLQYHKLNPTYQTIVYSPYNKQLPKQLQFHSQIHTPKILVSNKNAFKDEYSKNRMNNNLIINPQKDKQIKVRTNIFYQQERRIAKKSKLDLILRNRIKDELYLHRANQYAFVHQRIQQLQKSFNNYSRHCYNSYQQAIERRKRSKSTLKLRRQKLFSLLNKY